MTTARVGAQDGIAIAPPSEDFVSLLPKHWANAFLRFLPWAARCRWLAQRLQALQRHQDVFANAAYSVVSGVGPYTLEDALCSAESMQTQLAELAEHLAAISVMRALGPGHRHDPDLPAGRP